MGVFLIFIVLVIVAVCWSTYAAKKRREAMFRLAVRLGLQFSPAKDRVFADRCSFLNKLRKGSNRYAYNRLSGTVQGHEINVFDYHYETYSTDSKGHRRTDHHHFSFFTLTLDSFFPELTVAREGIFSKLAQAVGYDDIDFESHAFSKKFVVRSKDKKFAYDFCNARMIDYLLGHPGMNIEVDQNNLALGFNRCLKVEEIEVHLDQLVQIRSLMPDYLFEAQE